MSAAAVNGRLWSVKEVAHYLNVTDRTVYRLAHDGWLPGVKIGFLWRFDPEKILAWVAKGGITRQRGSHL